MDRREGTKVSDFLSGFLKNLHDQPNENLKIISGQQLADLMSGKVTLDEVLGTKDKGFLSFPDMDALDHASAAEYGAFAVGSASNAIANNEFGKALVFQKQAELWFSLSDRLLRAEISRNE